jgi:hypothetical protein
VRDRTCNGKNAFLLVQIGHAQIEFDTWHCEGQ